MTKVKGQGSIVTASFDGKAKSMFPSLTAIKSFEGVKNLVLLSIKGNDYCQGAYLGAIVEQSVNHYEFTTFLIADEIYWHNLKTSDNLTPENESGLRKAAIDLGGQYFEEQLSQFLKPLKIDPATFQSEHHDKTTQEKIDTINSIATKHKFEIIRWRDWAGRASNYQLSTKTVFDLYVSEQKLAKSLKDQAENFTKRHLGKKDDLTHELLYMRSYGYLREESFYIIWLSARLNYNFIVYPGSMPEPFVATKEYFVRNTDDGLPDNEMFIKSDKPDRLANWLEVNFTRRPTPEEQTKFATPGKPARSGSTFFKSSPTGIATDWGQGSNFPDTSLNISEKQSHLNDAPIVAFMIGVTPTVLKSELPYAFKENFINNLVYCLSPGNPSPNFDQAGMTFSTGFQFF